MRQGVFCTDAYIRAAASAVGKKEAEGPLGDLFDLRDADCRFGVKTWEGAESEMQRMAMNVAMARAGVTDRDVDVLFAGDLLNQCVGSAYGLLGFDIPYIGLYGACSTCSEGLLLSALAVTGGSIRLCAAVTSSHYCAAERQYRTPIEYGGQRAPTAQWTVTGAGAFLVGRAEAGEEDLIRISRVMIGKAVEKGICDANNMGAAMAPAAADTLLRFFGETGESPSDFDLIVTGDLGFEGGAILEELMHAAGCPLSHYNDCGKMIFDRERQDVHSGGSGCGCSAVVLASHILPMMHRGEWRRVLFLGTGAMMSPDSLKQGKSIPAVAHLVELTRVKRGEAGA